MEMRRVETKNDGDESSDGRRDTKGPSVVESLLPAKAPSGSTLGTVGNITLWVGSAVLAASVIFISFLWITAHRAMEGYPVSEAWRIIIDSGRLTQSITLSTVVLRLAMGLQGGLMASMLAALTVERYPPSLYRGPEISMMRASGTAGPAGLFWSLVSQPDVGRKGRAPSPALILAFATLSVVLASNFASTALISDLGRGWYTEQLKVMPVNIETSGILYQPAAGTSFINNMPEVFPTFAEYREPPINNPSVRDTGLTIRAYPPFPASQRSGLNYYSGESLLVDSRVMCINPGEILSLEVGDGVRPDWFFQLSGVLDPAQFDIDHSVISLSMDPSGFYAFNCSGLPYKDYLEPTQRSSVEWRMTACHLRGLGIHLKTPLDVPNQWESVDQDLSFLLLNHTRFFPTYDEAGNIMKQPFTQVHTGGEWRRLSTPSDASITLTVCVASFYTNIGNITMQRGTRPGSVGPQPDTILGSWINSSGGYDTSRVRALYGAARNSTLPHQEDLDREIFSLHNNNEETSIWAKLSNYNGAMYGLVSDLLPSFPEDFGTTSLGGGQFTIALCIDSTYDTPMLTFSRMITLHRSLINIFQDILVTMRNPALALQTLFTIVAQRAYYDALSRYNEVIGLDPTIAPNVTVGFTPSATMPVRWGGYLTVIAIVGIHLALLCIITTMFMRMTKSSSLGDFWATFGQTCGHTDERVRAILEEVGDVSDDNVKKWVMLKERGQIESLSQRRGREEDTA